MLSRVYVVDAVARRLGALLVIVLTLMITPACGQGTGQHTGATDPSSTSPMPMSALMIVRLAVDPETGCVGVVGETAPPDAVPRCSSPTHQWPKGMKLLDDPPRLVDGAGTVVAREGDVLHLGGGTGDDGEFVVSTIEKVIPAASTPQTPS